MCQPHKYSGDTWARKSLQLDIRDRDWGLWFNYNPYSLQVRHGAALALREVLRSQAAAAAVLAPLAAEPTGAPPSSATKLGNEMGWVHGWFGDSASCAGCMHSCHHGTCSPWKTQTHKD